MSLATDNLKKISELQDVLQPLAIQFIERAVEAGIPVKIVQAYRSPEAQAVLTSSVTKAAPLLSYHQHRLAFDAAPVAYLSLPDWNPEGPLWARLGAIGQAVGLEWGGAWGDPDLPHFQIQTEAAPIRELKEYWEKFKQIMPITVTASEGNIIIALLVIAFGLWVFRRQL